jgi:hypothetical protein
LVTDPTADVVQVLQGYFYRWEIEADQKEEKDLLGVGQAQVWSKQAVARQPAFHVASYAMLLLAVIQCFGLNDIGLAPPTSLESTKTSHSNQRRSTDRAPSQ